jgi:hypothetical protein
MHHHWNDRAVVLAFIGLIVLVAVLATVWALQSSDSTSPAGASTGSQGGTVQQGASEPDYGWDYSQAREHMAQRP